MIPIHYQVMGALSQYDLRQIRKILNRIDWFEDNKIDLYGLISDLVGLLNALESVNDNWRDNFQSEINCLEIII